MRYIPVKLKKETREQYRNRLVRACKFKIQTLKQ